jgi:hypothetical protein
MFLCGTKPRRPRTPLNLRRNKMGRPIAKKFIGDGAGKIQVTAVKFAAGGEVLTESHIVRQRTAKSFVVTDGSKTETCTLVNKSIGGLGAGEFTINVTDSDGAQQQVAKMTNRKVYTEGTTWKQWTKDAYGSASGTVERVITGATAANPVVITSADHGLANGTKISIRKVVGMVELNVETGYTVASTATNTFALTGIDGSGYTGYTSGGIITVAAAGADDVVIDTQQS